MPGHLYQDIAAALRAMIDQGALAPGARLPSVRRIAHDHQVSTMTALHALRLLESEQRVHSRPGSGYYVSALEHARTGAATSIDAAPLDTRKLEQNLATLNSGHGLGLELAGGHAELYPSDKLSALMRQAIKRDPALLGEQVRGDGYPPLKQAIVARASQTGCRIDPQELSITSGCVESIDLALRAIVKPGDSVAVQSPTYFLALHMLRAHGVHIVEIPATADGIDMTAFETALRTRPIKAFVVIGNFNNPGGQVIADAQKHAIVALAARHDVTIIEDDIYGDTHFGAARPRPLRAYSDQVVLCSSFSKTLSPGLRIGWVAGARHAGAIAAVKYITSKVTPLYPQAAIAAYLANGSYDVHLRRLRRTLKQYAQAMRAEVLQRFPAGTQVSQPAGGFVLWVTLPPDGPDTRSLFDRAAREGLLFNPGQLFSTDTRYDRSLRLNFGVGCGAPVKKAIRRLAELAAGRA